MKTLDITPPVRGEVIDDPELTIGLTMSLGYARLLHAILEESNGYYRVAAIDSCLTQAIELAESELMEVTK
jgi:hypothetical protein